MLDYKITHVNYGFFESFPAGIKYGWNVLCVCSSGNELCLRITCRACQYSYHYQPRPYTFLFTIFCHTNLLFLSLTVLVSDRAEAVHESYAYIAHYGVGQEMPVSALCTYQVVIFIFIFVIFGIGCSHAQTQIQVYCALFAFVYG